LRSDRNDVGIAELQRIGPPPYRTTQEQEILRSWLNHYLDTADREDLLAATAVALRNERYSLADFRDLRAGHLSFSLRIMGKAYDAIDLNLLGYDMPVPFFVIDGRIDWRHRILPSTTSEGPCAREGHVPHRRWPFRPHVVLG
jgi:hypothetical protein